MYFLLVVFEIVVAWSLDEEENGEPRGCLLLLLPLSPTLLPLDTFNPLATTETKEKKVVSEQAAEQSIISGVF